MQIDVLHDNKILNLENWTTQCYNKDITIKYTLYKIDHYNTINTLSNTACCSSLAGCWYDCQQRFNSQARQVAGYRH